MNKKSSGFDIKKYKRYYTYIAPYLKKKRVRDYTFLILTLLASAFFAFSAIRPTVKTIVNLKRQIDDAKLSNTLLDQKINALKNGQDLLSQVSADYYLIDGALPGKPNIDTLVRQIENLAKASSVTVTGLSFDGFLLRQGAAESNFKPKTELKEISFRITVAGRYENLLVFMDNSNRLRRYLVMENFSFQKDKKEEGNQIINLNTQVKTYYRN